MKCVVGLILFSVVAISTMAIPVQKSGMVWYQPSSDYYNAHRAFVMQYASHQPIKAYRRNGQAAAGVTAFASGKKIATGTYLKRITQLTDQKKTIFN